MTAQDKMPKNPQLPSNEALDDAIGRLPQSPSEVLQRDEQIRARNAELSGELAKVVASALHQPRAPGPASEAAGNPQPKSAFERALDAFPDNAAATKKEAR